jgi:ParB family chromosome partitioning protein
MENKSKLGRGLEALFTKNDVDLNSLSAKQADSTSEIEIERITINPLQPREDFDEAKLRELADSIKQFGVIQPLTVKLSKDSSSYELISGERRLRACKLASLSKVPVYIKEEGADTDEKMLEMALIENIQREDLNPMELSNSFQRLLDECGLTQEQVAERVSKQRSTVANFLRLQKLPDEIKVSLRKGEITEAHARMLLRIENRDEIISMWHRILKENITSKNLEQITKPFSKQKKKKSQTHDSGFRDIESKLMSFFGTKVSIKSKGKNKGEITIEYYNDNDLDRIIEKCEK